MAISLTVKDGVALLQLDDGKVNALSAALLQAFEEKFEEAEQLAKAVVIAGRAKVFSAGFDLNAFKSKDREAAQALARRALTLLDRLLGSPLPVVAASTGHSLALGAYLLLACDLRIGARGSFKYGFTETASGVDIPPSGVAMALARLNPKYLNAALVQSRIFDPDAALEAGFLDEIVEEPALIDRAMTSAGALAGLPQKAYAANKAALFQATRAAVRADLASRD